MKLPALPAPAIRSPVRLGSLIDAERAALLRAKFLAWWDGKDFDLQAYEEERAVRAAEAGAAANDTAKPAPRPTKAVAQESDLFDAPAGPEAARITALGQVWGAGRIMPGDDDDERLSLARLGAQAGAALAIIGPGGGASVKAIAKAHVGPVTVFEWREEARPALIIAAKRIERSSPVIVTPFELDAFSPPSAKFDGVISFDEFSFVKDAETFGRQLAKMLTPGGVALVETYCKSGEPDLREAFSSAFAEPTMVSADALLDTLFEAGLRVDSQDDVTDDHLRHARAAFRRLSQTLESAGGLEAAVAREIAWEAEAWRARVALLSKRAVQRRLFVLSRRPDA